MGYVGCHLSISDGYVSMAETAERIGAGTLHFLSGIHVGEIPENHHRKKLLRLTMQPKNLLPWWYMAHTQ